MKKRLTSFLLVLALSFSLLSVSALAEFTSSDSRTLTDIYKVIQYLNLSPGSWQRNSVIGFLERILEAIPSNLSTNFALQGGDGTNAILDDVRKWTMFTYNSLTSNDIAGNLGNIQRNTLATADRITSSNTLLGNINTSITGGNNVLESINTAVSGINGYATETTLSGISSFLSAPRSLSRVGINAEHPFSIGFSPRTNEYIGANFTGVLSAISQTLTSPTSGFMGIYGLKPTLYQMVSLLQETLASEDDRQLAENYKENRKQAESDFLSGQSGKTSLGKGDFSNASQVGGALNDTFNMGGASKVSDFLSGFGSAGTESQAWFSQTTANNLNAVEAGDGTQGVSTFSDDGETMVDVDPDPYNMANIFDRYDWLEGVLG